MYESSGKNNYCYLIFLLAKVKRALTNPDGIESRVDISSDLCSPL